MYARIRPLALTAVLVFACVACAPIASRQHDSAERRVLPLIPIPASAQRSTGYFLLRRSTALLVQSENSRALGVARYFQATLKRSNAITLDLKPAGRGRDDDDAIVFRLDPTFLVPGDSLGEGYELSVSTHRILLQARTPHGLFNAAVTLWQLASGGQQQTPIPIPNVAIRDFPRFAWRGLMLDSVRHMQSPQFIERLLDQMAQHKLDVLHWHLSDDQGWRVPITQYPDLTRIGAWRTPASLNGKSPRYGGFYTRDEIRDIVRYAADRYITIVPEIEMPGHAQAAIASYPQFGVTGKRPPVSPDWGVHTWLFNVDDATFDFLDTVLGDVMRLFPGPYIHVGGDEAAKDQWQASAFVQKRMHQLGIGSEAKLQGWFTARIGRFVSTHGRKLIGWDEILEGGVPANAIVMSYRGEKGAIDAAKHGHDVVMAPSPTLYFDHIQSRRHDEPPGRPGVESLADVYAYDPLPATLNNSQAAHVLGAQGNLWSEYLDTDARVEHAAFPRVDALAEVLWSPARQRKWSGFLNRLPAQLARYRSAGIHFADSGFAVNFNVRRDAHGVIVNLANQTHFGTIHYTLDGSLPTPASPVYARPLHLKIPVTVRATAFARREMLARPRQRLINASSLLHRTSDQLASCKPPGKGLWLRLPGPAVGGGESVFRVDIFDPCWIYRSVDLNRIGGVKVDAARVPYNFQLWKDASKIVLRQPHAAEAELQVHLDTCAGEMLAFVPLARGKGRHAVTLSVPLSAARGVHNLCFTFARTRVSPMWLIDSIQLLPAVTSPH